MIKIDIYFIIITSLLTLLKDFKKLQQRSFTSKVLYFKISSFYYYYLVMYSKSFYYVFHHYYFIIDCLNRLLKKYKDLLDRKYFI